MYCMCLRSVMCDLICGSQNSIAGKQQRLEYLQGVAGKVGNSLVNNFVHNLFQRTQKGSTCNCNHGGLGSTMLAKPCRRTGPKAVICSEVELRKAAGTTIG